MNKALNLALYRILKVTMKILYRKGVAFADFNTLAKQAYVDTVEEELSKQNERTTTSKIAVITGLTRKDVTNLRKNTSIEPSNTFNRRLRVINGWLNDTEFMNTATMQPAVLTLKGEQGSFDTLVNRYSGDMSSLAVLAEMKRIGVLKEHDDGQLELINHAVIPHNNENEKLELLGTDVALLVSTIEHNLKTENIDNTYYQRKVSYSNLPEECLPLFRAFVDKDAQQLLLRFNDWLYKHDRDSNPDVTGTGQMQAGVGIYYFETPIAAEESKYEA